MVRAHIRVGYESFHTLTLPLLLFLAIAKFYESSSSPCRRCPCWFVGLLVCWFVGLLVCWFVGLLVCWFVGLLVCWFVGLLVCWFVGVLVCWCVGVLVCWCVGVLVCWCVGVLVCWCVGVLVCWLSVLSQNPGGTRTLSLCHQVWHGDFGLCAILEECHSCPWRIH